LGGYMMLHPRARVLTLVPIVLFVQFVELPAFLFLFVWFGLQLLQAFVSLNATEPSVGGVAFFAHAGGFVVGLLLVRLLRMPPCGRFAQSRSSRTWGSAWSGFCSCVSCAFRRASAAPSSPSCAARPSGGAGTDHPSRARVLTYPAPVEARVFRGIGLARAAA